MKLSIKYGNSVLSIAISMTFLLATEAARPQSDPLLTLAIFNANPSQPVPAQLWAPLQSALQTGLRSGVAANDLELQPLAPYAARLQILRADQVTPGIVVTNSITVYLHGDCSLQPYRISAIRPQSAGTLGWVERRHDKIEPFLHIDCNHLAQLLQPQSAGRNAEQRNEIMAQAIARVLLHEWLHVATQNPHHAAEGIAKAQFNATDLLAKPAIVSPNPPELSPVFSPSSRGIGGK